MQKRRFIFTFALIFLLSLNFSVLRSVRNTLAVVDLGKGAHSIPLFELFGALPASILMTWGLTRLLRRFSLLTVFLITLSFFIFFFLIFSFGIYPFLQKKTLFASLMSMLFYVVAECWKPALMMILFWGLLNQYTSFLDAKSLYSPLMLGASLGGVASGPLVSFATKTIGKGSWHEALGAMVLFMAAAGVLIAFLYVKIWNSFQENKTGEKPAAFSLKESMKACYQEMPLRLLSWIVIADYIAYSVGEVIFLDILKRRFPEPCDYCHFLGRLSFWSATFTVILALFVTPFFLKRCRWVISALATPLCLLLTETAFFVILRMQGPVLGLTEAKWLGLAVLFGSLQYTLCRSTKYTFLDASKELAFVSMSQDAKMKGKLFIDGICARAGRGTSSVASLFFIYMAGGVLASSFATGIFAIGITLSWCLATRRLGKIIDGKDEVREAVSLKNVG